MLVITFACRFGFVPDGGRAREYGRPGGCGGRGSAVLITASEAGRHGTGLANTAARAHTSCLCRGGLVRGLAANAGAQHRNGRRQ